jgi:hypothetical protein
VIVSVVKPVISPTYSHIRRTCDICNDLQISTF